MRQAAQRRIQRHKHEADLSTTWSSTLTHQGILDARPKWQCSHPRAHIATSVSKGGSDKIGWKVLEFGRSVSKADTQRADNAVPQRLFVAWLGA